MQHVGMVASGWECMTVRNLVLSVTKVMIINIINKRSR